MTDHPQHENTGESLEDSYARLGEENQRLRDELGKLKSAAEETEEERKARWGREILAAIDASGGRGGVI